MRTHEQTLPDSHLTPSTPAHEQERLPALAEFHAIDTSTNESFDTIAQLVARLCGTPVAMINLVEKHRLWITYGVGVPTPQYIPRHEAFCAHAILNDDTIVICDTTLD